MSNDLFQSMEEPESKVTPKVLADVLSKLVTEKEGEIAAVMTITQFTNGAYQLGFTRGSVEEHVGRLEIAKDMVKDSFDL